MQDDNSGLGRRPGVAAEVEELGDPGLTAGRVLAAHRARWLVAPVAAPAEQRLMPARGHLRETPPVAGDWVAIDAGGAIAAVLRRHGTLVRRAPETDAAQVLSANVDLALVTESLPEPSARRAERLAALALAAGVPTALLLTKADLVPDAQAVAAQLARQLGVADGVAVSARDGTGLGIVRSLLEPGATAVLLGRSGAGKSTLVNALLGEARQATAPVRAADGRGRHTTVTRELIALPGGSLMLDTPGLRSVGLWDGLAGSFADIDRLAGGCRFGDCRHESEPGCAVRDAIAPDRVAAWRKLAREQAWLEDRKAATRQRKRSARTLSREVRAAERAKRGR